MNLTQHFPVGTALGPHGHWFPSVGFIYGDARADSARAVGMVNMARCPPVAVATLILVRQRERVKILELNRAYAKMTRLRALDGGSRVAFLSYWRSTGIRLAPISRSGWMRSYGAVSATLSHLNALRWQVR